MGPEKPTKLRIAIEVNAFFLCAAAIYGYNAKEWSPDSTAAYWVAALIGGGIGAIFWRQWTGFWTAAIVYVSIRVFFSGG